MPAGGCVLSAVASLVLFSSSFRFDFLTFHDSDIAGRRLAVACAAPRAGSELSVRSVQPLKLKTRNGSARGAFPALRTLFCPSAGRIQCLREAAGPYLELLTLLGLGRIVYHSDTLVCKVKIAKNEISDIHGRHLFPPPTPPSLSTGHRRASCTTPRRSRYRQPRTRSR